MHPLQQLVINRLKEGLHRKSIQSCSRWAIAYRKMGNTETPWSFDDFPWLKEMHDADCEKLVGQKAAQMGFTEWALNTTFYHIDVKNESVLYVLPSESDASDFSAGRFDPALEASPHLSSMFSSVKNVALKRAGSTTLYVRGSRSRSKLKSIPVPLIVLDELEEMDQDNLSLVKERSSGQRISKLLEISTPTIENHGINAEYKQSTQEHFHFRCPRCSRWTSLIFPDCLVVTATELTDPGLKNTYLICKECKNTLPHETKPEWLGNGIWVPDYKDRMIRGFNISQLYSTRLHPWKIGELYIKSQYDLTADQELYNSKLGETRLVEGAQLSIEQVEDCKGNYKKYPGFEPSRIITMGVDVGHNRLHVEIDGWAISNIPTNDINVVSMPQVLYEGVHHEFYELDDLMRRFHIKFCIVDSQPARREAREFAFRHYGRVRLCNYGNSVHGKDVHVSSESSPEPMVTVDRTSWLDLSLGRFKNKTIRIPLDSSLEYKQNLIAPARIYLKDGNGNYVGRYVEGTNPDHFAHARNYAEIALLFAYKQSVSHDISSVL